MSRQSYFRTGDAPPNVDELMFNERLAARREGRRSYQLAAAYLVVDLCAPDEGMASLGDRGWRQSEIEHVRGVMATVGVEEWRFSPSRGSFWSADLADDEGPDGESLSADTKVAYEVTRLETHLRTLVYR